MLVTWIGIVPDLIISCMILYVPGAFVLLPWRIPPQWLVGLAPVMTMLTLAISGALCWLVGARWSVWWVLVVTVALFVLGGGIRRLRRRVPGRLWLERPVEVLDTRSSWAALRQYAIGVLLVTVLFAPRFLVAVGGPEHFLQRFDNVFHLNAIRWIVDTGEAFSPALSWMVSSSIYPLGWHQLNALVMELSGASITEAVVAVVVVVTFVVWPLSVSLLSESALRLDVRSRVAVPVLAIAFMSFPHVTVNGGGIYANFLGLALAPAVLACVVQLAQVPERLILGPGAAAVLSVVSALSLGWAHPNASMLVAALAVPIVGISVLRVRRRGAPPADVLVIGTRFWTGFGVVYVIVVASAWVLLTPGLEVAPWAAFESIPQAVGEVIFGTSNSLQAIWSGAFLSAAGIVIVCFYRRQHAWLLGPVIIAAGLYVVSAAFGPSQLRNIITGVFYNDARRTGSALTMVLLPFAIIALQALVSRCGRILDGRRAATWLTRPLVAGVVVAVLLAGTVATNRGYLLSLRATRDAYAFQERGDLSVLSEEEQALLDYASRTLPDGAVIANNPLDGSATMYALFGLTPLNYYMFQMRDDDLVELNMHLRDVSAEPHICELARETGITHVVVLDREMIGDYSATEDYRGLLITPSTKGFDLVKRIGPARLYVLTACG